MNRFEQALPLLSGRLALAGTPTYNLIVGGGTALFSTELGMRTTRDVDIAAMVHDSGNFSSGTLTEGGKNLKKSKKLKKTAFLTTGMDFLP